MRLWFTVFFALIVLLILVGFLAFCLAGAGTVQRLTTFGGIYAVCRPDNYEAVCFVNKSGGDHPISCLPLAEVTKDGACK